MKTLISVSFVALLILGGCATNQGPTYDGRSYNQIKRYETGVVIDARPVVISDTGTGTFLGAITGAVLGSTIGRSYGKTLAVLGGGLAGAYAGGEIAKSNGTELTVELDNGENVVVVVKGNEIMTGDRVKIVKNGSKVDSVYRIH